MGCASSKEKSDESSGQASASSKGKVSQSEVEVNVNGTGTGDDDGQKKRKKKYPSYDQKGFNRRIRDRLVAASVRNDIDELEECIQLFKRHHLSDNGDLEKAEERLYYLKLKKALRDGMMRKHYKTLDRAIEDAQNSEYADELYKQISDAEKLRDHLEELDKHSHDILNMDQSTYSEIHRYHHPPYSIHETMMAAFLLLGEKERYVEEWIDVQALLGKIGRDSVKRRVSEFDTVSVEEDTTERVKELLNIVQLQEVKMASNGAAAFYVWSTNMVKKIEKDKRKENNQRGTRNGQYSQMQNYEDRQERSSARTPSPAKSPVNNKTKSRGKK